MDQNSKIKTNLARIIQKILSLNFDPDLLEKVIHEGNPEYPSNKLARINYSFLDVLANQTAEAYQYIDSFTDTVEYGETAQFYLRGIDLLYEELQGVYENDRQFARNLDKVAHSLENKPNETNKKLLAEKTWSVFFSEAKNLTDAPVKAIEELRGKRRIRIKNLNPHPITSPLDQMIFTSNILLTLPAENQSIADLDIDDRLKTVIIAAEKEDQLYWFDHPIQIGVAAENNEVIYGLNALNEAVAYEKKRSNDRGNKKLTCVLSASVTHEKLHQLAKPYLENELKQAEKMDHLDLFIFTETETDALIAGILLPAAVRYLGYEPEKAKALLNIFGVDGEYGRHYSFLKAVSVLWKTLIDPQIKATFKIDLDQVFPQDILVAETGQTAFEHLCSPLWGATGKDQTGRSVELGMIAGALVNEKDIGHSLFTPDVPIPQAALAADELVFYSKLPQAISTQAEMLARYNGESIDGRKNCIQRVHVTGGTNGILVDSLCRHRPFTPSFFGRAEDQAYILSVLDRQTHRLAYVHKDGLIMRHDKEAFAQESIKAAATGKVIGDYTRILLFSAYARHLDQDLSRIKELLDPFTGCFISKIPITLVYLRFALKAMTLFKSGNKSEATEFIQNGVSRISRTLSFINRDFGAVLQKEREGWHLFYDILEMIEKQLEKDDPFSRELKQKAETIALRCHINI